MTFAGSVATIGLIGEARSNVVDALRTMLSLEPENIPDKATTERVRITLAVARRQTRDLGLDR